MNPDEFLAKIKHIEWMYSGDTGAISCGMFEWRGVQKEDTSNGK